MPTIVGDVIRVVWTGTFLGHNFNNVFHYKVTLEGDTAFPCPNMVLDYSGLLWSTYLAPMISEGMVLTNVLVVNMRDPSQFADSGVIAETGGIDQDDQVNLTSWFATAFRYRRRYPGQRNGSKRFCGVVETQVNGNAWYGSTSAPDALADELGTPNNSAAFNGWGWSPFVAQSGALYGANPAGYIPLAVDFAGLTHQDSRGKS
jgi:hypothetical protein